MSISDRLDQIEQRAEAATEGPWEVMEEVDGVRAGRRTAIRAQGNLAIARRVVTVDQTRPHHEPAEANVEFIAHARTDVPALVAALRAALDVHKRVSSFGFMDHCGECVE
ncbi:hypothetical protein K3888_11275 [Dietzia aurantiaca]|uniref:hypothetical protein n=1 Tax=Dietzia aurantiaca TaxID=983873 RepID=UPI001E2919F3|nr:hypothetical protein [Dietzia aurantiaca]MCD2263279.1 hypothetical protein [Dietzia aurantiaca]